MLRTIQIGTGRPISYVCDPNATFQPGMIAQMRSIGNDVVAGVSNGISPMGIIDDIKDHAFIRPEIDQTIVIVPSQTYTDGYGGYYASTRAITNLKHARIVESSFTSRTAGIELTNVENGLVSIRPGTKLNYKTPGSTVFNAFRTLGSYSYYVNNVPGEDSTMGSGRMTIWLTRGVFQTDQYELVPYAINSNLFVSASGKLTAVAKLDTQPAVGMVLVPPTAANNFLEFIWW